MHVHVYTVTQREQVNRAAYSDAKAHAQRSKGARCTLSRSQSLTVSLPLSLSLSSVPHTLSRTTSSNAKCPIPHESHMDMPSPREWQRIKRAYHDNAYPQPMPKESTHQRDVSRSARMHTHTEASHASAFACSIVLVTTIPTNAHTHAPARAGMAW